MEEIFENIPEGNREVILAVILEGMPSRIPERNLSEFSKSRQKSLKLFLQKSRREYLMESFRAIMAGMPALIGVEFLDRIIEDIHEKTREKFSK